MDGIRPKKGSQAPKRSAAAAVGGSGGGGGGGLPSAPGAQLDTDLVRETLSTHSRSPQLQNTHHMNNKSTAASAAAPTRAVEIKLQPFDVYVVLDFEATCEAGRRIADPEVIEFPMVLVDARTARPVAEFQRYVRPSRHPVLSAFCTELTGITQAMVETQETFPSVYRQALAFLAEAGLGDAPPLRSYCIVTCGDWDLKVMLPAQMALSGHLGVPASFQRWCNLKKCMGQLPLQADANAAASGRSPVPQGLPEMLQRVGLALQGRHHSGIDDCRNIAAVLCALLRRGHVVDATYEPPMATPASPQQGPRRWHAVAASQNLPPLDTLRSSLADGAAAPASVGDAPPLSQPRKETTATRKHTGGAAPRPRTLLNVDTSRSAVDELLGSEPASSRFSANEQKTVSKFFSTLLRHKADQWRVTMSANGYVLVDDILRQPQLAKKNISLHDVAVLVRSCGKQRFRLSYGADDGRLYIAAAQGHSLEGVVPEFRELRSVEEVPVAVHGTYWKAWQLIEACGYMSTMTRQHIHFAKGLVHDGGVISGMRADVQVFIYLDVAAVLADGVPLLESSNGVILTPGVGDTKQLPLRYVKKVVDRKTGRSIYPVTAAQPATAATAAGAV